MELVDNELKWVYKDFNFYPNMMRFGFRVSSYDIADIYSRFIKFICIKDNILKNFPNVNIIHKHSIQHKYEENVNEMKDRLKQVALLVKQNNININNEINDGDICNNEEDLTVSNKLQIESNDDDDGSGAYESCPLDSVNDVGDVQPQNSGTTTTAAAKNNDAYNHNRYVHNLSLYRSNIGHPSAVPTTSTNIVPFTMNRISRQINRRVNFKKRATVGKRWKAIPERNDK